MVQQDSSSVRAVGCFLWYKEKFLLLKRVKDGNGTWGLPAGKVGDGEKDIDAMIRELKEETGYCADPGELNFLGEYTWYFPDEILTFPTFSLLLDKPVRVVLNPDEHKDHIWVTPYRCDMMPDLVHGLHDLLRLVGYISDRFK